MLLAVQFLIWTGGAATQTSSEEAGGDNIKAELEKLKQEVEQLTARVEELETRFRKLDTQIEALSTQVQQLKGEISFAPEGKQEDSVAKLKEVVRNLQDDVSRLNGRILELQNLTTLSIIGVVVALIVSFVLR